MYSVLDTDLEPVFVTWEMNTAQRSDSLLQLSMGSLFLFTPERGNQEPKKGCPASPSWWAALFMGLLSEDWVIQVATSLKNLPLHG